MNTNTTSSRQWKTAIFASAMGQGPQVNALIIDRNSPSGRRQVRVMDIHRRNGRFRVKTASGKWFPATDIWLASS